MSDNRWWARLAGATRPDPFSQEKTARDKARAYAERSGPDGDRVLFERLIKSVERLPERAEAKAWEPVGQLPSAQTHWGWMREWGAGGGDLESVGADERSMFLLGCDARGREGSWARLAALALGAKEAIGAPYQKTPLGAFFEKAHPLEMALARGSSDMIRSLEGAGASWQSCRISDEALAQQARSNGVIEPLNWLERKGARLEDAGPVPLLDFEQWPGRDEGRAVECAKKLLALGADPSREPANAKEFGGSSPLSSAVRRGFGELAGVLLEAGANPEAGAAASEAFDGPGSESPAGVNVRQALEARRRWRSQKEGIEAPSNEWLVSPRGP